MEVQKYAAIIICSTHKINSILFTLKFRRSTSRFSSNLISQAMPGPHFNAGSCGSDSCDASCESAGGGGGGGDNDDDGDVISSLSFVSNLISMICVNASWGGAFSSESSEKSSSDVIKLWRFFSKFDKLTVCCNGLKSAETNARTESICRFEQ